MLSRNIDFKRYAAPWAVFAVFGVFAPALLHAAAGRADPASMQALQIPSHGALLNAFVYVAEGPGPHPAVVLLHGFPGNERNLDLAQEIRRAGWDVLYFNYRGAWGSPGDFSFSHAIEDTAAAIAYLRQPATARLLRLDPSRIALIGHSMGGFMAVQGGAADPSIIGIGTISAANLGGGVPEALPKEQELVLLKAMSEALAAEGMAPLAGCTPEGLAREILTNGPRWNFVANADALKTRPALIITSDDGLAQGSDALTAALRKLGNGRVTTLHLATDHSYSDQRGALATAVLKWLKTVG